MLQIEIYHPLSNSWTTLPADANATVPRNYHSVALLMPDGRVWIAGSNVAANWSFHNRADFPHALPETAQQGAVDNRELRIELFEPWYFGRPDRPTISAAPASAPLGGTMEVTTPQAATINRVVVLRAGSVTHAFNADQRYVGLNFTRHDGGLTVSFPGIRVSCRRGPICSSCSMRPQLPRPVPSRAFRRLGGTSESTALRRQPLRRSRCS